MRKTIHGMGKVNTPGYNFIYHHTGDTVIRRKDTDCPPGGLTVSSHGIYSFLLFFKTIDINTATNREILINS